jgi:hypothetical protein
VSNLTERIGESHGLESDRSFANDCVRISENELGPGDIGYIVDDYSKAPPGPYWHAGKGGAHAFVFVTPNLVFEKFGIEKKYPYAFTDMATIQKEYRPNGECRGEASLIPTCVLRYEYYRCRYANSSVPELLRAVRDPREAEVLSDIWEFSDTFEHLVADAYLDAMIEDENEKAASESKEGLGERLAELDYYRNSLNEWKNANDIAPEPDDYDDYHLDGSIDSAVVELLGMLSELLERYTREASWLGVKKGLN